MGNCVAHLSQPRKILFIETEKELIGIKFNDLFTQPEWNGGANVGFAPVFYRLNLLKSIKGKSIVGMKHVTLNANVYLLGGETLNSEAAALDRNYVSNNPNSYIGSSNRVFRLSVEQNKFSVKTTSHIKNLLYGKCSPMVEKINGKIYVLEGAPYLRNHNLNGPFEVYDPREEYFSMLACPPPYLSDPQGTIIGHFILGNKFIVFERKFDGGMGGYSYDTRRANEWVVLHPNVIASFMSMGSSLLPIGGICVSFFPQLRNNGMELFLTREGIEEGYALVVNSTSGSLMYYQSLMEVFRQRFPCTSSGQRIHLNNGRNYFFALSHNLLCAIWVAFDHDRLLRLFITTFELELSLNPRIRVSPHHPTQTQILNARNIHNWDYVVPNDEAYSSRIFDTFLH
ncbi:hypothetical protein RJT34_17313 [Clitoria ternatea]|uniref:Uncharacterized protein n=1 Tax=Clitoria ternatea TaxID=43366 RepID=A0AAN9PEG0_CLITE